MPILPFRPSLPATCRNVPSDISAVTYNTALAPGINPWSSARLPHIASVLAETRDDDVVCLQEVWRPADVAHIVTRLGYPPEQVFWADTRDDRDGEIGMCSADAMQDVLSCAKRRCGGASAEALTICGRQHCATPMISLYLLHRSCFRCIVSSVGKSLDEIARTCTTGHGGSYVYGGANGVILASRWPLTDREAVRLPSSGAHRVALLARMHIRGRHPIEVACTHLSADEEVLPFNPRFSSWSDERDAQFRIISRRMRDRAGSGIQMLLGDMNFGIGRDGVVDDIGEDNWRLAESFGWDSPAARADKPLCTECGWNSFIHSRRSHLIDHIFVRRLPESESNAPRPLCAEVLFNRGVILRTGPRQMARSHLSDHFGLRVRFRIHP
jgi:endonuclease/exonuclease/phosphatase family metal-dependent hydrolase